MSQPLPRHAHLCPDCDSPSRRDFLKTTAAGVVTAAAAGAGLYSLATPRVASAIAYPQSETLVAQFYKSLSEAQKKEICFPFDHELRSKVDNNWFIVKPRIGTFLNKDQQQMVHDIFMGLHSEEYADKVYKQVHEDSGKIGFNGSAVAMFGEPGQKFEFVFTGRHVTRRCDGNSVEGEGFGGPIFYGHAAHGFYEKADHPDNIYWYQALQANEVFKALDGKQRKLALLETPRPEHHTETVALKGVDKDIVGIPMTELTADQKGLVRKVMADLLAPFRKSDSDKALKMIEDAGFDHLHMAFFNGKDSEGNSYDIGNDGVWDVWQLEGPNMVWYFRGEPHVHTWVHVREPKKA
jgi:hypothetical protein